jgi:cytochrome c556
MALLNKWAFAAVAAAGVAALASGVVAQDKAAVVKARQDFMKAQAADTKAINDYAKGMGSKADAEKAIADLQARNPKILDQLAPGTSMTDMPGVSYTKPAAFTEKDKLVAIVANLKGMEDKLANTIKTGTPEQVGMEAAALGPNGCGACHKDYRQQKPRPA